MGLMSCFGFRFLGRPEPGTTERVGGRESPEPVARVVDGDGECDARTSILGHCAVGQREATVSV